MKKLLALGLVLVFVPAASAQLFDDFDSYADQAALDAAWGAGQVLDQAKGYSGNQSVTNKPAVAGVNQQLVGELSGSDAAPIEFSVMVDVDELGWSTRSYLMLYAYDGGGTLEGLVSLGFTSTQASGGAFYHGRMYGGGDGWIDIEDGSGAPVFDRSTEWTKLTALIKTDTVEFYVNDILGYTSPRTPGITFDTLKLGTTASSANQVWFDDLSLQIIPEPASLALLAMGGLALVRRRR